MCLVIDTLIQVACLPINDAIAYSRPNRHTQCVSSSISRSLAEHPLWAGSAWCCPTSQKELFRWKRQWASALRRSNANSPINACNFESLWVNRPLEFVIVDNIIEFLFSTHSIFQLFVELVFLVLM